MGPLSLRVAIVGLLAAWGVGAVLLPLGGMIHVLLVVALVIGIVDRVGRG